MTSITLIRLCPSLENENKDCVSRAVSPFGVLVVAAPVKAIAMSFLALSVMACSVLSHAHASTPDQVALYLIDRLCSLSCSKSQYLIFGNQVLSHSPHRRWITNVPVAPERDTEDFNAAADVYPLPKVGIEDVKGYSNAVWMSKNCQLY
jgi:hypothetical protein